MTEPTDRTYDMLQQIGEFLKKLKKEEYDSLLAGDSRLMVVPKGARISAGTTRTAEPVALAVDTAQIDADLRSLGDRQSAARYLDDLKLKKAQILQLAKELNVHVRAKDTISQIRDLIVEQKVGHRLAHDAILRQS
ncbi:hypothetical protein ACFO1B_21200 [Dactylosporangium siamense]|uniref:Uncharacterized protein n=1 Tax=Dactylosporangium siamense TaxID=685454 RepID=A0A919PR10_9ACTN|nr:hypothetical protein [Dactylosporangium siamense]GIG46743.1 hypothetical protein Dsi01nite_047840 [Dactylosporangium siamense]